MNKSPDPSALATQLLQNPLFADLEPADSRRLTRQAVWRTYDAGAVVCLEGDPSAGLYVLESGWLKVVRSAPSGREQVVAFLAPGDTFNEIGALASRPNPATAVALEQAGVWLIPSGALLALQRDNPSFALHLVQRLAERVLHLVDLVTDLSLRTLRQRLARLLLEDAVNDTLERPNWYTQAELAARLGTVPDVVQRALRQLSDEGSISVDRRRIVLRDPAALRAIADSGP